MVFFLDPETIKDILIPNFYLPFFVSLFLALFFTLSIIFINTKKGLIFSLGIICFFILRLFGLGNVLNVFLILGLLLAFNYYFTHHP